MTDINPINISINPTQDILTLEKEAGQLVALADAYEIDSNPVYEMAGRDLTAVKARMKAVDERRKAITRPLDEAKKAVMDLFGAPMKFLEQAETTIKQKMLAYTDEQARKERVLRAQLEEQARKERERIAAEARAAQAKADEEARKLREKAEAARAAGEAEKAAKFESRAESRETAGAERAEELAHQAAVTVAPMVAFEKAEVKGVATREEWDFEITDRNALPLTFMIPDEKAIRAMVKARKGDTNIPGVRVFSRKILAARAR